MGDEQRTPETDSTLTNEPRTGSDGDLDTIEQHYEIEGELGRGGVGRVLRARDRRLRRPVAVKVPLEHGPGTRARFVREALVTARLQHPSIVPIYEAGRWPSGEAYYAMKLVAGRSLDALLGERRTLDERLALLPSVVAVADAIAYAHDERIVHRDLKPSNVVVGPFGETVVLDWGLAKDLAAGAEEDAVGSPEALPDGQTATGTVMGTPRYMSPEQGRGLPVDERADVYALGAMLYHLLAGAPPFAGISAGEALQRVLDEPPAPIARQQPGTPPDLAAIVDRAMAPRAADRYPTAKELAADLHRFQTGQLVSSRAYSLSALLLRWMRRHRLVLAVAAVSLAALAATAGVSFRRVLRARAEAEARRNQLYLAQAEARLAEDPTEAVAWLKLYPPSGADWTGAGNLFAEARALGVARAAFTGRDLNASRDGSVVVYWSLADSRIHVASLADGSRRALPPMAMTRDIDLSSDGQHLTTLSVDGELRSWDLATLEGRTLWRAPDGEKANHVDSTPDGKRLVVLLSSGASRVVDRDGGGTRLLLGRRVPPRIAADSDDSRWHVSGGSDGEVRMWELASGEGRLLGKQPSAVHTVALSPDGKLAFSAGDDGAIHVWDTAGGAVRVLKGHEGAVRRLLTADGKQLVTMGHDKTVRVWDVAAGSARILGAHRHEIIAGALSEDGRILATADEGQVVRLWTIDGRPLARLRLPGQVTSLSVTPDGRRCISYTMEHQVRIWDVPAEEGRVVVEDLPVSTARFVPNGHQVAVGTDDGRVLVCSLDGGCRLLGRAPSRVHTLAVSPDGAWIASGGDSDRDVRLWSVEDGKSRVFSGHQGGVYVVTFSPDGKRLATASANRTARIWDVATGDGLVVAHHQMLTATVMFSPDGAQLASLGFDGAVRLWNGREDRLLGRHDGRAISVAFSPDGKRLFTGGEDARVRVWNLDGGEARELRGHTNSVWGLATSPDGRRLASASLDRTIRLWDLASGDSRVLRGHRDTVRQVRFASDSRTLVSGASDGVVRVWDGETGVSRPLIGHESAIRTTLISADGRWLLSASGERVRLWPLAAATAMVTSPSEVATGIERISTVVLGADDQVLTP